MKGLYSVLLLNIFVFCCLTTSYCQQKTDFKTKLEAIKAEMAKPAEKPTPIKKLSSDGKICIGLTKEQVLSLLGKPCFKASEFWKYGISELVRFDSEGFVCDWDGLPYKSPKALERDKDQPPAPKTNPRLNSVENKGKEAVESKNKSKKAVNTESNFCVKCGNEIGSGNEFCGKCGRKIDGKNAASSENNSMPSPSISIQVGIDYSVGGFQPAVGQTFLLQKIVSQANDDKIAQIVDETYGAYKPMVKSLSEVGASIVSYAKDCVDLAHKIAGLQPVVDKIEVDASGKAIFKNVAPGDYRILGLTPTRGGVAVWFYKISVANEDIELLLDGKKAAIAF